MSDRLLSVGAIEDALSEAREKAISDIKKIQAKCPHDKIVESPWRSSDFGSSFPARRICVCCGVEEVIGGFSWPNETIDGGLYEFQRAPGQRTILNSEFIKQGDVCAYRVNL